LGKSIDGLMVNNYKSINAANNMLEVLEEQNNAILNYLTGNKQEGLNSFYKNNDAFYSWFNIEYNNITEAGEKQHTENIKEYYIKYLKYFSTLQDIKSSQGEEAAANYYVENITPVFSQVKSELKAISQINEKSMFSSKERVTRATHRSLSLILILSAAAVVSGFFLSMFFINKFLKPMHLLTETMKSVKEGNLDSQAPVLAQDEVGDMAKEFNNMTKRLQEFEQSTLGRLMSEKNKSYAIVKSISDPLIVLDMNYRVILLNNACEKFFNINENKALNRHFLESIHNGDLFDYISSVNEAKSEYEEKIVGLTSNGDEYYFNIIVKVVRDRDALMNGVVVLFQNVTQLKQLEKIKTEFVSTVSHEFKTPLTSIMMGTSLISNQNIGTLNEKQKQIIDTIKEESERLSALINNLLQLSKIQSDKSIFEMKLNSMEDIIITSVKTFLDQAQNKGVDLFYTIDNDLPKVNVDFEKMTWVINNLVSNALKHTDAGDKISVKASIQKNKMLVSVKDTGSGIPEEYLDKIFNKFVQVSEYDQETNGTGLGLAIAKEIVEAHDGEIWCESKLGSGSVFTFTLPLV
jgi:PAS domain S-box-containing protein